jgi:predicted chitinase
LANHVYKSTDGNSAPGDGFKYRGRGFIQHTGKNQYAAISKATGTDLLSNPDALNSPEVASKAIAWFFLNYKRLKPKDMENISKVNKAVGFADDKAGTQGKNGKLLHNKYRLKASKECGDLAHKWHQHLPMLHLVKDNNKNHKLL